MWGLCKVMMMMMMVAAVVCVGAVSGDHDRLQEA